MADHVIPASGLDLHVRTTGDPDSPAVLCLHSLFIDGRMFEQFSTTADEEYVVRIDLPSHGRSATDPGFGLLRSANMVREVMSQLDIDEAHVVAQSMGADVALHLILDTDASILSLTALGASAAPPPPERADALDDWAAQIQSAGFSQVDVDRATETLLGTATRTNPDRATLVELVRTWIAERGTDMVAPIRAVARRPDLLDQMADVHLPLLAISGTEDKARPTAMSVALVDAVEGARLEVVEGVGHTPVLEAPAQVDRLILDFIRSIRSSR